MIQHIRNKKIILFSTFILFVSQTLNAQLKIKDFTPYFSEIAKKDTAFQFSKTNNTLYLTLGTFGSRIEIVNQKLYAITPIDTNGHINGYRQVFKPTKKYNWPDYENSLYINDTFIESYPTILIEQDIDSIEFERRPIQPKTTYELNDSINSWGTDWSISSYGVNPGYMFEITSTTDSTKCFVNFLNGQILHIGFKSIRNNEKSKVFYVFDKGKLIYKIRTNQFWPEGEQIFYYKGSEYTFYCREAKFGYNCYCNWDKKNVRPLYKENSKYIYLYKQNDTVKVHLPTRGPNYTYSKLLSREFGQF
ncbi:hypothetical protein K6119_13895 [Paracrocinitomix mangrovi]|uniref:hypothetical protein n=1 Tax=Paracrocinitomix mangrovi TaxID=2862509 RepID=UPI001C8DD526|nr:hypothetical protein [Paracrocinitomix mangrovi]UKN00822.1 hypothetical protein K6119_13895 [Paracrocinitomix mangrovi]